MLTAGVLLHAAVATVAADASVSVYVSNGAVTEIKEGVLAKDASAAATFEDTLMTTGWGILNIKGRPQAGKTDSDIAYAAGVAEGYLTANRIKDHYANMYKSHFGSLNASDINAVKAWLDTQYDWSKAQVKAKKGGSVFWEQVGNVLSQFDGLVEGYNRRARAAGFPALDRFAFSVLNGDGDLFQVIPAVVDHKRPDFAKMSNDEADTYLQHAGKCSSIIKVTGNFSDLFMGHSSWYTYTATNRIFKHYDFQYQAKGVAAQKVSFSSYPGYLESLDDFYMMDSGLGMVQTSISFSDSSFYDLIKPQSLLAWQRVRTAHVVSSTGEEWHQAVSTAFSGTYCNQYMVVDYKKFKPGQPLAAGTLWVMEEIPGQLPGADLTEVLSYGYWPSYNVPYFKQVYAASGMEALAARGVPSASYQLAPRAKIFRRDADKVVDLATYKAILRDNEYKTDPYSSGPCDAICCRGDLGSSGRPSGCFDTKATNHELFWKLTAHVQNGPTRGGADNLPAFSWKQFPEEQPVGLPATYQFPWVTVQPREF